MTTRFIRTPDGVYRNINSLIGVRAVKKPNIPGFNKKWIIESSWLNMDAGGTHAYGSTRKLISIDELSDNSKVKNRLEEIIRTDPSMWWED